MKELSGFFSSGPLGLDSFYDVIIVGTGAAGLTAALHTFPLKTLVITKTESLTSGSTPLAQGGIAFPLNEADIPVHIRETLESGAGLCRPEAVNVLVKEAIQAQDWLEALDYPYDRDLGILKRGREGGHSLPRVLHAGGDASGKFLSDVLLKKCSQVSNLTLTTHVTALKIAYSDSVKGLWVWTHSKGVQFIKTSRLILAGGGMGQLFGRTTNPPESTGDTLALGMEAGAESELLEMVQFHPTGLDVRGRAFQPLLTEALRGSGARLVLEDGSDLQVDHPLGVLGTRDAVSRAVYQAKVSGHRVFMDARTSPGLELPQNFPSVLVLCLESGLDPRKDLLPITPVVHYHMGGLITDLDARTSIPGLWAVGECASSGIHGANRLASNSLLECLVFGRRAGLDAANFQDTQGSEGLKPEPDFIFRGNGKNLGLLKKLVQKVVFEAAGPLRTEKGLERGVKEISVLEREFELLPVDISGKFIREYRELKSFFTIAPRLLTSAFERKKSIGAHWIDPNIHCL